ARDQRLAPRDQHLQIVVRGDGRPRAVTLRERDRAKAEQTLLLAAMRPRMLLTEAEPRRAVRGRIAARAEEQRRRRAEPAAEHFPARPGLQDFGEFAVAARVAALVVVVHRSLLASSGNPRGTVRTVRCSTVEQPLRNRGK